MTEYGTHYLPVVESERPVGMVGLRDVTRSAALLAGSRAGIGFGERGRGRVLALTALAALAGVAMNVSFHLANGSAHPWLIPEDDFDEGVDLDSLMPAIQLVLAGSQRTAVVARPLRPRAREVADHRLPSTS